MRRTLAMALFLVGILLFRVCDAEEKTAVQSPPSQASKNLQALLDGFVSQPDVVNYVASLMEVHHDGDGLGLRESPIPRRTRR